MKEYIVNNAKVRVHGATDRDKLQDATCKYLKQVVRQRKKKRQETKA